MINMHMSQLHECVTVPLINIMENVEKHLSGPISKTQNKFIPFHSISRGHLYFTRTPLFHKDPSISRGPLYFTRTPLFHEDPSISRGPLYFTRTPLFHEDTSISRGHHYDILIDYRLLVAVHFS